jgi:uncharacterized membrane protein (DUF4010 family)
MEGVRRLVVPDYGLRTTAIRVASASGKQQQVAQGLLFRRLCGFALIDSITREVVTGKRGNMIAGPVAATELTVKRDQPSRRSHSA